MNYAASVLSANLFLVCRVRLAPRLFGSGRLERILVRLVSKNEADSIVLIVGLETLVEVLMVLIYQICIHHTLICTLRHPN